MKYGRRGFLASLGLGLSGQEWRRYADPATEFEVRRLTEGESRLPVWPARAFERKSRLLVYAAQEETGWAARLYDTQSGVSRAAGEVAGLRPESLSWGSDDKVILAAGAEEIVALPAGAGRRVTLAKVGEGWTVSGGLAPSEDGTAVVWVEEKGGQTAVRRWAGGVVKTLVEGEGLREAAQNPKRALVLWRAGAEAWVAGLEGKARRLETAPGRVTAAQWSPDGQAVLYLLEPAESGQLVQIRQRAVDGREDALVAKTTQYGSFARNADASVFLGASRSVASPHVLLLLRATKKELTLAEHKSSDGGRLRLAFAPNSQRIVFQSDRHGAPAIYWMNIERLVEKTGN